MSNFARFEMKNIRKIEIYLMEMLKAFIAYKTFIQ
jgi:hypothetical protein